MTEAGLPSTPFFLHFRRHGWCAHHDAKGLMLARFRFFIGMMCHDAASTNSLSGTSEVLAHDDDAVQRISDQAGWS